MFSGIGFLSSPLRPTANSEPSCIYFSTPQFNAWSSYPNHTTSPLQTSRNANIMSRRRQQDGEDVENTFPVSDHLAPSFFLNSASKPSESSVSDHSSPSRATHFQYESRARMSAPTAQLRSKTATRRDSRKQLFLDRLRGRRDDDRFERGGDQLLRLDYIKERKAWEQRLKREEVDGQSQLQEEAEAERDSDMRDDVLQEDLSPTEDQEIEELVSFLKPQMEMHDEFSDDDYEALFMEVLSQESRGQDGGFVFNQGLSAPDDTHMDM